MNRKDRIHQAIAKIVAISLVGGTLTGCGGGPNVPAEVFPDMTAALDIRAGLITAGPSDAVEDAAELAEPTGFATLRGVFTLDGPAPANPILSITKDTAVCMPGGQPVQDQVIITGANQGLANVLLYVDGMPDAWAHESMIGSEETVDFDQKNCLFVNRIFPIQTTQKLKILNSDPVGHNADMKPSKNLPYNPNIAGGGYAMYPPQEGELKEEKAPFSVSCGAHPWMKSHMIFRKTGYFAVTDQNGAFEIPLLPAGVDLKISVWHEAFRFVPDTAVEADKSIAKGWNKRGSFTVNLPPDSETELDVSVKSSAL